VASAVGARHSGDMIAQSPTLAIDQAVTAARLAGRTVLHLGFGEAGLPVLPSLVDVLAGAATRNGYGPVRGTPDVREAAAGWFGRRELPTSAEQVLVGPGSKALLFAVLAAVDGAVVLPCPAWVSYAAQAALLDRTVIPVPIAADGPGGVPDPERLDEALRSARRSGIRPGVLVLTVPDNPTGTVATVEQLRDVCLVAERFGLAVVCDEIYAELCHAGTSPSAAAFLPDRTVVTSGLSKSVALGGWRIGFARTPDGDWGRRLHRDATGVASEVWSSLAAPMQAVAAHVLADPPDVLAHIAASRRLHGRIVRTVHDGLADHGVAARPPEAGFYVYPDFGPHRETLRAQGIATGTDLAAWLMREHDVATLPGVAFGEPTSALTLRLATSQLYGDTTEDRWTALRSDAPETLPWVAGALTHLDRALSALVRTEPARG